MKNTNSKVLPIILAILAVSAAIAGAGCTSSSSRAEHYAANWCTGVVGFTIVLNVSVRVTQSAVYTEDNLHYRDYEVITTMTPGHDIDVSTITDRTILNPHITEYDLWNDVVGTWEGTPWFMSSSTEPGSSHYTTTETGSIQGDPIYDIPKAGQYVEVFGQRWTFSETIMDNTEQVATYLRIKIEGLLGDSSLPFDVKIPFMGTIPAFDSNVNYVDTWFEVQFYVPVGGAVLEEVPDQYEIQAFTTTQSLRAGYTQATWGLEGPEWWVYLSAVTLAAWGIDQLTNSFGGSWGSTSYFSYGGTVRPHGLEKIDPAPSTSENPNVHCIIDVTSW